jgi:hypothetical protein
VTLFFLEQCACLQRVVGEPRSGNGGKSELQRVKGKGDMLGMVWRF